MRFRKSKEISAYIPTASMADIVFLLIIFFMVASVFPIDKTQVDLPQTEAAKNYAEDSAVIAITSENLEWVRNKRGRRLTEIADREQDKIVINVSDGRDESNTIVSVDFSDWRREPGKQYETLKEKFREFVEDINLRAKKERKSAADESKRITVVIKADSKVPFRFPDAVIKALQEIGGDLSKNIAILSKRETEAGGSGA